MKRVKYVLAAALMLVAATAVAALPYKVVERSGKKPSWVSKARPGYLILSAEALTLDEARNKCMESVKQEIVQAVAVNVSSEIFSSSSQRAENGKYEVRDEYRSDISSVAARLPFINDITIANAEETYWEVHRDKETDEFSCVFYVLYPFGEARRRMLIDEFKAYDKKQYDKLLSAKAAADSIASVEDIARCLADVEPLVAYFFDATRNSEAVALRDRLKGMYNAISVVEVANTPGEYVCRLVYEDRGIASSRLPKAKSDYAYSLAVKPLAGGQFAVTYGYEGCVSGDDNSVELVFNFGGVVRKHVFHFEPGGTSSAPVPQGMVRIAVQPAATDSVPADTLTVSLSLRCTEGAVYELQSAQLYVPEYPMLTVGAQQQVFTAVGKNCRVQLSATGSCAPAARKASLTEGTLVLRDVSSGALQAVQVRLPYEIVNLY